MLNGVVEASSVDEDHRPSIEGKFICQLNIGGIRFLTKAGVASHIDELNRGSITDEQVARHPYRSLAASCNPHDAALTFSPGIG